MITSSDEAIIDAPTSPKIVQPPQLAPEKPNKTLSKRASRSLPAGFAPESREKTGAVHPVNQFFLEIDITNCLSLLEVRELYIEYRAKEGCHLRLDGAGSQLGNAFLKFPEELLTPFATNNFDKYQVLVEAEKSPRKARIRNNHRSASRSPGTPGTRSPVGTPGPNSPRTNPNSPRSIPNSPRNLVVELREHKPPSVDGHTSPPAFHNSPRKHYEPFPRRDSLPNFNAFLHYPEIPKISIKTTQDS